MLFHVKMIVRLPPDMDPARAGKLKADEKALAQRLMDALDHDALVVGLKALYRYVQFPGQRLQGRVNIRQGGRSVL